MILELLSNIGYAIVSSIIGIFPVSTGLPAEVLTSAATIGGYVQVWDVLFPVATFATVITLVFSVEISIFGFKTVKWILSHLPFIGGRG